MRYGKAKYAPYNCTVVLLGLAWLATCHFTYISTAGVVCRDNYLTFLIDLSQLPISLLHIWQPPFLFIKF